MSLSYLSSRIRGKRATLFPDCVVRLTLACVPAAFEIIRRWGVLILLDGIGRRTVCAGPCRLAVQAAGPRVPSAACGRSLMLRLCSAQVLALRALTGMAAVLAQRVSGLSSLDADLAALEAGGLPPDQRAATMLVANKKRVLNGAAQALAAALKVRPLLRRCVAKSVFANECRATTLTANKKHACEAARTCVWVAMKASLLGWHSLQSHLWE